jgi:hypothetical protein
MSCEKDDWKIIINEISVGGVKVKHVGPFTCVLRVKAEGSTNI